MIGRVLVVAGSDSGGGAGIQADIKTIALLGGYAATAITALTIQNTFGVSGVHAVPPNFVQAQMRAVLDDLGADVIKTGMLGDAAMITAVAEIIAALPERPALVVDPVMVAKGGARLLDGGATSALLGELVPLADLVTPNAPELAVLTGCRVASAEDARAAGRMLLQHGAKAVLAKGGHLDGPDVVDWLITREAEHCFTSPRIPSRHTHGTGCTLASAIATGLAQHLPLSAAVARARDYVRAAIAAAPGLGGGHGPLGHNFAITAPSA